MINCIYPLSTLSTRPFVADLELAVASLSLSLPFLPLTPIPSSFTEVSFQDRLSLEIHDSHSCVVALFFGPKNGNLFIYFYILFFIFIMYCADVVSLKSLSALRETIINGNPEVALLSTLSWDTKSETMKFRIETTRLGKMIENDWYVRVVRVDTYAQASGSCFQLKSLVNQN